MEALKGYKAVIPNGFLFFCFGGDLSTPASQQKHYLGFSTFTPCEGPVKAPLCGGSRPALPGLHDCFCHPRSLGSFGLRVVVVEHSAKTLGLSGFMVKF